MDWPVFLEISDTTQYVMSVCIFIIICNRILYRRSKTILLASITCTCITRIDHRLYTPEFKFFLKNTLFDHIQWWYGCSLDEVNLIFQAIIF